MTEKKPTPMERLRSDAQERQITHCDNVDHGLATIQFDWENLMRLLGSDDFEADEIEELKEMVADLDKASQNGDSNLERVIRLKVENRLKIRRLTQKGKLKPEILKDLRGLNAELDDAIVEDNIKLEDEIRERVSSILRKAETSK